MESRYIINEIEFAIRIFDVWMRTFYLQFNE